MNNTIFDLMAAHDYENIFFCYEKALGLKAIIAIPPIVPPMCLRNSALL